MTEKNDILTIQRALEAGKLAEVHRLVQTALRGAADASQLHYLDGRAYMKASEWGAAMSCFKKAEELDPKSPAGECRQMLEDIMAFYNKDMYNQ